MDSFGNSSKALGANRSWVLTHFHADHYMGLSKGFKQGNIFCTPITAALVKLKLRVPDGVLVPLPLGQEVTVEGECGDLLCRKAGAGQQAKCLGCSGGRLPTLLWYAHSAVLSPTA